MLTHKFKKLAFSVVITANKGLLALITLLDVALGGVLDLVRFSQLYSLGSTLTPLVGGGASTLILRNGYRSSRAAMSVMRALQWRLAVVAPLVALLWIWRDDLASALLFAFALVLTDSAINLMRSHKETIAASACGGLRLLALPMLVFIAQAMGATGMAVWILFVAATAALSLLFVIYAQWSWPKYEKVESGEDRQSAAVFLIVMFALNAVNANFDRLVAPEVFSSEFIQIYVPVRNVSILLLVIYPMIINYVIDGLMERRVDTKVIIKAIVLPAPLILFAVTAIGFALSWRLGSIPTGLWAAILASWGLATIIGGFSLLSSWLLGHTVGSALIVVPACLFLGQAALLALTWVIGSPYVFGAGMAALACIFLIASPFICRLWMGKFADATPATTR